MPRLTRFLIALVLLVVTVPWLTTIGPERLFGLPSWAVYSLAATAVYPLVVILLLQFHWDSEDPEDPK